MISNEIVTRVVESLERPSIPYMPVGSYSNSAFGIARSTQDADFIVQADSRPMTPLFVALTPLRRFDQQMQLETVTMTSPWVGEHTPCGFKVERCLVTDDPHEVERFARRRLLFETSAVLPTPGDVVIQKLRWFHWGCRPNDSANVVAAQVGRLDLPYLRGWCDRLASRESFEPASAEAERDGGPEHQ